MNDEVTGVSFIKAVQKAPSGVVTQIISAKTCLVSERLLPVWRRGFCQDWMTEVDVWRRSVIEVLLGRVHSIELSSM